MVEHHSTIILDALFSDQMMKHWYMSTTLDRFLELATSSTLSLHYLYSTLTRGVQLAPL